MKNNYLLIFTLGLATLMFSCSNQNSEDQTELQDTEQDVPKECQCYDGIGSTAEDAPVMTVDFSNGKSVSVCGYMETEGDQISEFNIFDCENGTKYVEYGALDRCIIVSKNDTIVIKQLKSLPAGSNWSWEFVQIGEQLITSGNGALIVSDLIPKYETVNIEKDLEQSFIDNLKEGAGFGEDAENEISKLEVLSLNGNERAWEILEKYEEFTGTSADGALAEALESAVSNVKRIKGLD